jgi:peroxiredoxin Q/BCP
MRSPLRTSLHLSLGVILLSAASSVVVSAQTQAGTAAAAFPAIGQTAPDFSATATDSSGKPIPISLSALRGKVVVLAFYPGDRTRGCTAELTKFRDEYRTMFGDGVVVLPTSIDSLGSHASWAKEAHFPFAMISDQQSTLARMYGSQGMARPNFQRTVFVIGKDGRIAYADTRFNALAEDGYTRLAEEIAKAKGA